MYTYTEENYLKAIFHLSNDGHQDVSTNELAEHLQTRAASVTDMLRKLSTKELINYEKYQGVTLTRKGRKEAIQVIRKHRLWESFLVNKLKFSWDEVHEIAEQLEHIQSTVLIERLDEFLGNPSWDPHGDPIPNSKGEFKIRPSIALTEAKVAQSGEVVSLKETSAAFLKHLDKLGIYIGARIKIKERSEFDGSMDITIDQRKQLVISKEVGQNIMVAI